MRPELHFNAMGTTCSLFGEGDLEEGRRWVDRIASRITRFDRSSELSRLNASNGRWSSISPELEEMLRHYREIMSIHRKLAKGMLADRPDLGPGVSGALLTALEKDPAARPQSAGAYAELLRAAFA